MMTLPPFPKKVSPGTPAWRGMTLHEIQIRRVVVQTRMEIEKYRLSAGVNRMKERTPWLGGSGLLGRLTGMFSLAEYAFMAFKVVKWIVPKMRRK